MRWRIFLPRADGPAEKRFSSPWFVLSLLLVAVVISFIDRQVLGVLVDPIRRDLGMTDFQIGLVGGPAFFVVYFIGGIVGGWSVDRFDRPIIIALGMAFWSCMTAACGFSAHFFQIALARMGVGFGEGSLGPGVHSLIADSFDKKRLPMAMSIYTAAGALGSGISLFVGGWILQSVSLHPLNLPILGAMHAWQLTFMAVSIPGVLLAPSIWLFLKIPPRVATRYDAHGLVSEVFAFGKRRLRLVILYTLGVGTVTGAKLSFVLWIPTLLMRIHRQPPGKVGATLGIMFVAFGFIGSLIWGLIATIASRRGHEDACMRTMIWAVGAFALMVTVPPLMPTPLLVLVTLAPCLIFAQSFIGLGHAAVQLVTPSQLRGRVSALFNGTATLLGVIVGPTGIGALSTYFFSDDQKLGQAIAIMTGSMSLIGFFCLLACRKQYRQALQLLPDPATQPGRSAHRGPEGEPEREFALKLSNRQA